uniref:Uncharacterized protein n=1 Tax=Amphilophus citrinellus TaxID=61819 RepID=A0A3Q0T5F9_AMPCI
VHILVRVAVVVLMEKPGKVTLCVISAHTLYCQKYVIPFTIQRLCELLTEPKRNYTGTDKFLRGVEKNVMVVSCVHPTSEKNGCSAVNRMNGVMPPGNASAFTERLSDCHWE